MKNNQIIVAYLGLHSHDGAVLRAAQKMSQEWGISWSALYIETPGDMRRQNLPMRNRVLAQLSLAERMGAKIEHRQHKNVEQGVKQYLKEKSDSGTEVRYVIIREAERKHFWESDQTIGPIFRRQCKDARCEIIELPKATRTDGMSFVERYQQNRLSLTGIIFGLLAVVVAGLGITFLSIFLPFDNERVLEANRYLLFLIAAAVISGRYGLIPGLVTAVSSLVYIIYFYMSPHGNLKVSEPADILSMALFLLTAVTICAYNSHVRSETGRSETNERRMQALLQIYRIISHVVSREEAVKALHEKLQTFLNAQTAFFLAPIVQSDTLEVTWPESAQFTEKDNELLTRCWQSIKSGTYTSVYNRQTGWRFEPLVTINSELGVLAIRVPLSEEKDGNFNEYLHMVVELVSSILEKIEAVHLTEESRVQSEREKLRTTLLSSVSHDLKTPLASIIGSLSIHHSMYDRLPEAQRRVLTETALEEAQRLDNFITNILELAKIESGAIKFKHEWCNPIDMVLRVKRRLRMRLKERDITLMPPEHPAEVWMDQATSEQALFNILDNAIKYTPVEQAIDISVDKNDNGFSLHVRDYGQGIPENEHERIFDKYTRLHRRDSQVAGTGLGLALARALVEGQGGRISVRNHPQGGAEFTLWWPTWREAENPSDEAA